MTAHVRTSGRLALALCAAAMLLAAAGGPSPAAAAPTMTGPCAEALAYERTAASDTLAAQQRYDSAVAGLTANQRCRDSQVHLVNEAYLLSMRAPAEHDLKIGNWRQDLTRANMLLLQCTNWPGLKGTKAGIDCDTQRRYNTQMAKTMDGVDHPPATPSPAPGQGYRSPTPVPSGYRASPPPPPQLSQPVTPNPSPTPRH